MNIITSDYRHTENFQVKPGETISRGNLGSSVKREIKAKEKYLGRKCGKIWWQSNRLNEDFVFARFNKGRGDTVIVTLAAYVPRVGWVTSH